MIKLQTLDYHKGNIVSNLRQKTNHGNIDFFDIPTLVLEQMYHKNKKIYKL